MPCISYDDDQPSESILLLEAQERNHELARHLCVVFNALNGAFEQAAELGVGEGTLFDFLRFHAQWKTRPEVLAAFNWWQDHSAKDDEETETRKLRHQALNKLSPEEKRALGLESKQ